MSRDIRRILTEIRSALDAHPREALTEILSQLFKEYVVDGPAPVGAGAALLLNARTEIDGMSFPQLIQWLQSHHDAPELAQFEVQGERVLVRIAGRLTPLDATTAPQPVPAPAPVASPPPPAAPQAVQAAVRPMPVSTTPPVNTAPPRPQPAGQPATAANPTQPAPQPAAPAPAAQPAAAPREESGEAASRFSFLEVD